MIIPKNLAGVSSLSGFKNYSTGTFSAAVVSQNIAAGGYISATASTPLNNSNATTQVQVQYAGIQTAWNAVYGSINNYFAAGAYEIESFTYFDSTNVNVFSVIANQTGGVITIPAITINCRAFLYKAPF